MRTTEKRLVDAPPTRTRLFVVKYLTRCVETVNRRRRRRRRCGGGEHVPVTWRKNAIARAYILHEPRGNRVHAKIILPETPRARMSISRIYYLPGDTRAMARGSTVHACLFTRRTQTTIKRHTIHTRKRVRTNTSILLTCINTHTHSYKH